MESTKLNPIDIFGNELVPLLSDMIKDATKESENLKKRASRLVQSLKRYNKKYLYYYYAGLFGLEYDIYWNERALENMAKWYSLSEGLAINEQWERDYEEAQNTRIEDVFKNYFPTGNYRKPICCPIHKDKSPSLHVYTNTNSWHCFGCGAGSTPIDFVMASQGLDFKEAVKYLSR